MEMIAKITEWIAQTSARQQRRIVAIAVGAVWIWMAVSWVMAYRFRQAAVPELDAHPWRALRLELPILGLQMGLQLIPGLMAMVLMFLPASRSRTGALLKGIAVVLLVIAPFFGGAFWLAGLAFPFLYAAAVGVLAWIEQGEAEPEDPVVESGGKVERISAAQWRLVALIAAFAVGSLLYHLLMNHGLGHSAALFLGIPLVIAILLALTPKAKTVTGGILKGITLALLLVAPLLGEGYLCILMASPLFYLFGAVVGVAIDAQRRERNRTLSCVVLVLLVPMSLEGVIPALSFNRTQRVEAHTVLEAPADAVERQLAMSPDVTTGLPAALRIGFPRPLAAHGSGLNVGATRTIHFAGAEGDPPGDLTMRVAEHRAGYARFETVGDTSKLTQWIRWDSSEVEWRALDHTHTEVLWRVRFERQLDPAWYFTPLERAAVGQAAKYLIQANATPRALAGAGQ
jgi:hypothetical protein